MVTPPMAVCVKPTVFERIRLEFMTAHFFIRRSIPAMKSNIPMARNIIVNIDVVTGSAKTLASIMFSSIRKIAPVKIRLVTIRKPPMATLSLTSFRIHFTQADREGREVKSVLIVKESI
jgi:hypothetical protein